MGLFIPKIELPKACDDCILNYDYYRCIATGDRFDDLDESFDMFSQRTPNCPLQERSDNGIAVTINAYFDNVMQIVNEIGKLQTYKFFPDDTMLLVDRSEVCDVLVRHVAAERGDP